LVYLDESGIDNTEDYSYGYCKQGERFHALKAGSREQRISMIAALHDRKIIAPLTFEGHCNTAVFEAWVEQCLAPVLQEGQTIILDNATFHKSKKIKELIEKAACELLYLPPYSPDFNDIEHEWFPLKNRARKNIPLFDSFRDAVDAAFL
jgi:transposase